MRLHRSSNFQAQRTPLAWLFGLADFILPLTHSIVPTKGTAPVSFTRASSALVLDNEGKYVEVPTNCARMEGARYVRNLFSFSEDFSNVAWVASGSGTPTKSYVDSEHRVTWNAGVGSVYQRIANACNAHNTYRVSFEVKLVSGDVNNWTISIRDNPLTQQVDTSIAALTVGVWTTVTTILTMNATPSTELYSHIRYNGIGSPVLAFRKAWIENVTGQADQTASEYVSVDVLSWPFHGLGVDGIKAFTTNKDGTAIPDANLKRFKSEGARTNPVWPSNNLTHANWVKTNVTPVLNATGIRGFPNTATTLTAAANGATITYPVALSGTRAMSIFLKRSVGTGTIEFTHDGTTWTDVTSSLSTSAFFRVRLENKTVSNPHSIGLRFGTSGDAVIACAALDEDGPTVSTPIITTTAAATRAADSGIVFNRGSVLVDNAGTAYAKWSTDTGESTYLAVTYPVVVDVNGRLMYANVASSVLSGLVHDGSTFAVSSGLSHANTTLRKQVTCWSGTTGGPNTGLRTITEGNTAPSTGTAYDTTMGAASTFTIGAGGFLNVGDVTLWGNRAVTDAQMVELVK